MRWRFGLGDGLVMAAQGLGVFSIGSGTGSDLKAESAFKVD